MTEVAKNLPTGIVGGGILGLAIGRELTRRLPGIEIVVFEKEDRVAVHQTGHNSGVVHAGIYYKPGSLKAVLCAKGRKMLGEYCQEHDLPFEKVGKLVVAVDESELDRIDALEQTARENEVPGLRRIGSDAIRDIEPHATGITALHSPDTAITDFVAVANAMADDLRGAGGSVLLSTEVQAIERRSDAIVVRTRNGDHRVGRLVICAGLQSDRVAKAVDGHPDPRIVPFRGEYMNILGSKRELVRGLIYPVPDPRYPFLGVHFTKTISGAVEIGPNAVLALKREGYRRSSMSLADVGSIVSWPGFWRVAKANWRSGLTEIRDSMSIRRYMEMASRYVPAIGPDDVERGRVGVRAQAVGRDGSLVDDFRIFMSDGVVSIRNAPSPGATSSLAIAEYVVDRIFDGS